MNITSSSFQCNVVKKLPQMSARILISLVFLASASFAVTHPLSQPRGLAVDAKGNLYVANWAVNQILIYSPTYQQLTGRTITTGLNGPMQLTFDVQGNLWVAKPLPRLYLEGILYGIRSQRQADECGLHQQFCVWFLGAGVCSGWSGGHLDNCH